MSWALSEPRRENTIAAYQDGNCQEQGDCIIAQPGCGYKGIVAVQVLEQQSPCGSDQRQHDNGYRKVNDSFGRGY